jgi:tetratricopeptide (TPR) repeat protein
LRHLPDSDAVSLGRRLVPVFEDVIARLEMSGEAKDNSIVLPGAIGMLGLCHVRSGEFDTALQWFDKGLRLFPNSTPLLIARGIHLYVIDPERSRQDFQRAIQLRFGGVWPYFFLAHYYLMHEQYAECLDMAQAALPLASSAMQLADCLEWIAICQANLSYPSESVFAMFSAAQQSAPNNQRIAKNRQLFEQMLTGTSRSRVVWERPERESVRSLGQRELQPL